MLLHVISYCFVFTVELSHTLCVHQELFTLLLEDIWTISRLGSETCKAFEQCDDKTGCMLMPKQCTSGVPFFLSTLGNLL